MKKIIITAPCHKVLSVSFAAAGYQVIDMPSVSYEDLLNIVDDAEGLVVTTRIKVDRTLIDAAPKLKWIGRLGSGLELIDVKYATENGIKSFSTPEGNCTAVGEYALMLLLSSMRRLLKSNAEVKENRWIRESNRGTELNGKALGIIGYGNTGAAFAKAASGIGMRIMAYDKFKSGFDDDFVEEVNLETIQSQADFISFHIPLSAENIYMCDAAFLDKLVQQPFIINTSRGSVISQKDLLVALQSGKISGAALDVLENEQVDNFTTEEHIIFEALNKLPQVIITPHIAGYTHEAFYKMSAFLLTKLGVEITELP